MKQNYSQLGKCIDTEYLLKCHNAFYQIVRNNWYYKYGNIIAEIAEPVIVYYYKKSVNDKSLNNKCPHLFDVVNLSFMRRLERLINWRIHDYMSCSQFAKTSSLGLLEEIVEAEKVDIDELEVYDDIENRVIVLEQLVENLSEKQRMTIKYFYYQDYTIDEISKILLVSKETVKSNKKDALRNLRKKFFNHLNIR